MKKLLNLFNDKEIYVNLYFVKFFIFDFVLNVEKINANLCFDKFFKSFLIYRNKDFIFFSINFLFSLSKLYISFSFLD